LTENERERGGEGRKNEREKLREREGGGLREYLEIVKCPSRCDREARREGRLGLIRPPRIKTRLEEKIKFWASEKKQKCRKKNFFES